MKSAPRVLLAMVLLIVAGGAGPARARDEKDSRDDDGPNRLNRCRTIDEPGAYVLNKNLQAHGDCIIVTASFVTIDLNGYTLFGNGSGRGIGNESAAEAVTVRHGSITNFTNGILLVGSSRHVIEDVRLISNLENGIRIQGGYGAIRDSVASGNGMVGIRFSGGNGNSIIGNVANHNQFGIRSSCPSTLVNNVAFGNIGPDIDAGGCTRANNSPAP
jgi:hypothetical protein